MFVCECVRTFSVVEKSIPIPCWKLSTRRRRRRPNFRDMPESLQNTDQRLWKGKLLTCNLTGLIETCTYTRFGVIVKLHLMIVILVSEAKKFIPSDHRNCSLPVRVQLFRDILRFPAIILLAKLRNGCFA